MREERRLLTQARYFDENLNSPYGWPYTPFSVSAENSVELQYSVH